MFHRSFAAAAASVFLLATPALADEQDDILAACQTQAFIPSAACPCFAERAMQELNETQRSWLIASVQQDNTTALSIQGDMTQNELVTIGMFMAVTPQQCAAG